MLSTILLSTKKHHFSIFLCHSDFRWHFWACTPKWAKMPFISRIAISCGRLAPWQKCHHKLQRINDLLRWWRKCFSDLVFLLCHEDDVWWLKKKSLKDSFPFIVFWMESYSLFVDSRTMLVYSFWKLEGEKNLVEECLEKSGIFINSAGCRNLLQ